MGNLFSYLEKAGELSFGEMPLNEVDALILSQFSYLKFDGLLPKLTQKVPPISMAQMQEAMQEEIVFSDERYEKDNRHLFLAMAKSKRFQGMKCGYYASILDEAVETQFCAMTCFLEGSFPIVVFRGTDENLVGWKEDFHMAFKRPVPGQQLAALYLHQVSALLEGEFYVCGHSKGGNLAVYSSMHIDAEKQQLIKRIYSFDGPGFRPEILNSQAYEAIADRIEKYIPKSSLVGMLLENHEDYIVIDSSTVGLLQHNPYTWRVENHSFVGRHELYKSSQLRNEALNEWILKLDDEQLEIFVSTLFQILEGCDVKNLIDMAADWKKSIHGMIHAYETLEDTTKEKMQEIFILFFEVLKENLKKL